MSVSIKTNVDASGFRAGLDAMRAEGTRFRDSFRSSMEQGGGLFGSIDRGLGSLASGRFAAPIAALSAGMMTIKGISDGLSKHWENIAAATGRARQNVEAIDNTRDAVAGQRYSGDSANANAERSLAAARAELATAQAEAARIGDPTQAAGRADFAREIGGTGLRGFFDFLRLSASQYIPGIGESIDEASAEYNRREERVDAARQEVLRAEGLQPFTEYANRTAQRSGVAAQIAAEDRLGVTQGRTTAFEAAANALLLANQQYEDTKKTFGENDPRTQSARASALDAFTAYDTSLTQSRRFRNDPTIVADSLARLGGGGNVGVFGDGRGELLFEQKRLTTSIGSLTQVMQNLNVTLSRANLGGDVD